MKKENGKRSQPAGHGVQVSTPTLVLHSDPTWKTSVIVIFIDADDDFGDLNDFYDFDETNPTFSKDTGCQQKQSKEHPQLLRIHLYFSA